MHEVSAGGLVVTTSREVPVIGRRGRRGALTWSLPKGHLEVGETPEQTAVREIEEETGVRGRVIGALGTIDFRFVRDARRIHKTVHHFVLGFEGGKLRSDDHEVAALAWVSLDALADRLSYRDERRLVVRTFELLEPAG